MVIYLTLSGCGTRATVSFGFRPGPGRARRRRGSLAVIARVRDFLLVRLAVESSFDTDELALYEYDGGVDKHRPELVVFPRNTADVDRARELAYNLTNGVGVTGQRDWWQD